MTVIRITSYNVCYTKLLRLMDKTFMFFDYTISTRLLVATMNFLMWFGNTTILLMAGIMGIDQSLFEAGQIDGATSMQVFFKITLPIRITSYNVCYTKLLRKDLSPN